MITLEPITEQDFTTWQTRAIQAYAQDKIAALTWRPEDADARSAAEYHRLLPQGRKTPNEYLWTITHDGVGIGTLWAHHDPAAQHFFIYDIVIVADQQNHGFGQAALQALDKQAQALGVRTIGLHVFGGNLRAQHVYHKLGFVTTDINMTKTL